MTHRLSLRAVLVLLVLLAIVPGVLIVVAGSIAEQREQLGSARSDLAATTRLVATSQAQLVEGVRNALTALASGPAIRRPELLPLCAEYMVALKGQFGSFSNFGLIDTSGHTICVSDPTLPSVYAGDRAYYQRALQSRQFAVGEFSIGRASGKRTLPFGMPVFDPAGAPRGVVFAALDLTTANARFGALGVASENRVFITDAKGQVLVSSLADSALIGRAVPDAALLAAIAARRAASFEAADAQGEVWLHELQPIDGVASDGLFAAVSTRRADALAPSVERLKLQLLALAVATLLGATAAWLYGNQAVARPAQRLLERMRRVERDETSDATAGPAPTREFIALDSALSTMASRLKQRADESGELLQRLQRQRAQLLSAQRISRTAYWTLDIPTQDVTWSAHASDVLGFEPLSGPGAMAQYLARAHPDDATAVQRGQQEILAGRVPSVEHRVLHDDGQFGWIHAIGEVEFAADGTPLRFLGSLQDITERKRSQQHIEAMNQRIGSLLESMTDGFVALDRDWRFTYVNVRATELLGRSADWLLGKRYLDAFPEAEGSDFELAYRRALDHGESQHVESYFAPWDRWFENHVYVTNEGLSLFFHDVTPRKRGELAMDALLKRLQMLRDMDGALLEARSPHEVATIGMSHLQALVQCWVVGVTLFDMEAGIATLLQTNAAQGGPLQAGAQWSFEAFGQDDIDHLARGEVCHVSDVAHAGAPSAAIAQLMDRGLRAYLRVPIRNEGRLLGAASLGANRDEPFTDDQIDTARAIADRIALALQQAQLRERIAQHAQQLEQRVADRTREVEAANRELEAFSYSVSHDLRAPLQAIDGFSRALQQRLPDQLDAQGQHYLARIRAGTQHMAQLIDDLLLLARVSRADQHLAPINLADIARDVVERLRARDPGRHVRVDVAPHLKAHGDSRLMTVVLENLLDNAWKFTAKTDAARIEVGQATGDAGHTVYFVADNGAGFDMRYADKLFGAFQRLHTTAEFPGTGIGLATVHRIVTRHGGRVWAESVPGVRTAVHFTLADDAVASARPA